jgi:hypothetical protein
MRMLRFIGAHAYLLMAPFMLWIAYLAYSAGAGWYTAWWAALAPALVLMWWTERRLKSQVIAKADTPGVGG